jgi:hypothetical protein
VWAELEVPLFTLVHWSAKITRIHKLRSTAGSRVNGEKVFRGIHEKLMGYLASRVELIVAGLKQSCGTAWTNVSQSDDLRRLY